MAESRVPSHKGKDKAEMSRAVWSDNMKKIFIDLCIVEVLQGGRPGSNLKTQSWTRIIEGFKEKTGILYGQKQLKNQWDGMRKQYNAWITLCGQTGVGLNEATQTITMDPERWDEYLKGHPEAKIFRTRPLSFSDEMGILFGGTQARGEDTWTPSSGSFPEELNTQMPSPPPHIDNTQNHVQGETFEDISTEELMTSARRKRPCPSRSRRDVRNNKYDENMERLVIILEEDKKEEDRNKEERKEEERKEEARKEEERKEEEKKKGPTMQDCIDILKQIPNIQATSELYFFGTRAFKDKDNRDIFMSFESNDARLYWLNMIMKHGP